MAFPRLKNMLPNYKPTGAQSPLSTLVKQPVLAQSMPAPKYAAAHSTLPSLQSTANSAIPIELGDPKRLAKIGAILRMGRK